MKHTLGNPGVRTWSCRLAVIRAMRLVFHSTEISKNDFLLGKVPARIQHCISRWAPGASPRSGCRGPGWWGRGYSFLVTGPPTARPPPQRPAGGLTQVEGFWETLMKGDGRKGESVKYAGKAVEGKEGLSHFLSIHFALCHFLGGLTKDSTCA